MVAIVFILKMMKLVQKWCRKEFGDTSYATQILTLQDMKQIQTIINGYLKSRG